MDTCAVCFVDVSTGTMYPGDEQDVTVTFHSSDPQDDCWHESSLLLHNLTENLTDATLLLRGQSTNNYNHLFDDLSL